MVQLFFSMFLFYGILLNFFKHTINFGGASFTRKIRKNLYILTLDFYMHEKLARVFHVAGPRPMSCASYNGSHASPSAVMTMV